MIIENELNAIVLDSQGRASLFFNPLKKVEQKHAPNSLLQRATCCAPSIKLRKNVKYKHRSGRVLQWTVLLLIHVQGYDIVITDRENELFSEECLKTKLQNVILVAEITRQQ